jgi:hypothetical protein
MRTAAGALVVVLAVLSSSSMVRGQAGAGSYNALYNKLKDSVGPGGTAPVHDMGTGWFLLRVVGAAVPR